ncbi:dynamin family protein, partial [Desulfosarcina cetonica]|uniref:dynamin family protein n=1 Tax=Desulfosarcina cetonica TaxID=90730 RepID=UPI000AC7A8B2
MDPLYADGTSDALACLKSDAITLAGMLGLESHAAIDHWRAAVEERLLPRLTSGFPLVAAICGGGSSGKSTLFNSLVGEPLSPTGGRAGINRRLLLALGAGHRQTPGIAGVLFEPFGGLPQPLTDKTLLATPGETLLHYAENLPANVALVDTPDFDTGARGSYQNRDMAEAALRAADVLIYIFTNANYNNRDNTDFIARMLTAVGTRDCFLVYRVDPGFSASEVRAHAGTVAANLYGDHAEAHVLGVYRADEDNRVAEGSRPMTLTPVDVDGPGLMAALAAMDARAVRGALNRSIFTDVVDQAGAFVQEARDSRQLLELYRDGLRTVQQQQVREALGHLPMDAVVRRFSEIWQTSDPTHIRIMRQTGRVVEAPVRLMMRATRWIRGKGAEDHLPTGSETRLAM